jgi:hypothetical protein
MLRYEHIANKEKDFLAMTGYTKQEFLDLLPYFQQSYEEYLRNHTIEGYDRIGQVPKSYHTSPLPTSEDKLLFILVCLKQNPTQTMQGYLFGVSQSNANKWIHLLHAVLNRTLERIGSLPQRGMVVERATVTEKQADGTDMSLFSSTTAQNAQ